MRLLDEIRRVRTESVELDETFPIDDGSAAVVPANDRDAGLFLRDEFTRIGVIHAPLADTRLVTTPTLLSIFVRRGRLSRRSSTSIRSRMHGVGTRTATCNALARCWTISDRRRGYFRRSRASSRTFTSCGAYERTTRRSVTVTR